MLFRALIAVTAAILIYQLFIPPIVGLADQGDYVRVIGPLGYGQSPPAPSLKYVYVPSRFVRSSFRVREWEQPTSESIFVAIALLVNRIVSKDGSLSILMVGGVHAFAFLLAYARLLQVTKSLPGHRVLWIGATVILSDVGYVAYWNSLFREPASLLFLLLLVTETIDICRSDEVSTLAVVRWILWAVLFLTAKEQNTPLAPLLAVFLLRLRSWARIAAARRAAVIGLAAISSVATLNIITSPVPEHAAAAYNVLFLTIIPESRNAMADLETFGLSLQAVKYSGTNAWSNGTGFYDPEVVGATGTRLTPMSITTYFLTHPARLWRHVVLLTSASSAPATPAGEPPTPLRRSPATSLRPEFSGNFEQAAGYPPGARSRALSLWSVFHERTLSRVTRTLLFLLLVPLVMAAWYAVRTGVHRWLEFAALLSSSCLLAFLTAAFGDGLDNVKHMYLFNILLDACLLWAAVLAVQLCPVIGTRLVEIYRDKRFSLKKAVEVR